MKILSGKKTYSVAIGMILAALQPIFTETGFDIGALNLPLLLEGLGLFTLRQGVAKSGPPTKLPEMPGS